MPKPTKDQTGHVDYHTNNGLGKFHTKQRKIIPQATVLGSITHSITEDIASTVHKIGLSENRKAKRSSTLLSGQRRDLAAKTKNVQPNLFKGKKKKKKVASRQDLKWTSKREHSDGHCHH